MASKLRVDQLEDLLGTKTHTVADLITNVGSETVGTLTGSQTVVDALNSRRSVINVKDPNYGATGDGVTDDLAAIQAAVDAASPGDTIYFPAGHYFSANTGSDDDQYYVIVEKSGIRFIGDGSQTVIDFSFKVRGSISSPVDVSGSFGSGDSTVTLASSLGVNNRDWIQLWGVCHPYSSDAGAYQLGGYNPTKEELYDIRFGEFVQVRNASNQLSLGTMSPIIYPKYQDSTAGLTDTIVGVDSAEAVAVNFIEGFTMANLRCEVDGVSSFDRFKFYYVKGLFVDNVEFNTLDTEDGRWLRIISCLDVDINNTRANRDITGYTGGASWNSYIIGGGSMEVRVRNSTFRNQAQTIDFTPSTGNATSSDFPASFVGSHMVYTNVSILNCDFINCSDAGTTHPGGWGFRYQGNSVYGAGGLRCRSRSNNVSGNRMESPYSCVSFSAFYDDTVVSGNVFMKPAYENATFANDDWNAITFVNFGSETNNNNTTESVAITGNLFVNKAGDDRAINFRQYGNGTNPTSGIVMTDAEKVAESQIVIEGNTFVNCTIYSFLYWNGILVRDNKFLGNYGDGYIEMQADCGGWEIVGNFFEGATHIVFPSNQEAGLTWPEFTVADNEARGPLNIANSGVGSRYKNFRTFGDLKLPEVTEYSHGSGIKAVRSSGFSDLILDSVPEDGTSDAHITLHENSPTSGLNRTYNYGRMYLGGPFVPLADASYDIGFASSRWREIYASNGTINTSDGREKQQVRGLSETERAVATELKGKIRAFRWNHAVEKKGDGARWHFGVIAQEVHDVFASHGLDAAEYGMFCYDEWDDDVDGSGRVLAKAGNRYGIRYEQLMAFIISAL